MSNRFPLMRVGMAVSALIACSVASAQIYSTGFEAGEGFAPGGIHGQQGWSNSGAFNANVVSGVAHTGSQSLYRDNQVTAGSFGDQTFSPGIGVSVGESTSVGVTAGYNAVTASMWFLSGASAADNTVLGWALTDAAGSRSWSVNFRNTEAGGIQVYAFGGNSTGDDFPLYDLTAGGLLDRGVWHRIDVVTNFIEGVDNDTVDYYLDGALVQAGGTTWEQYYRLNPEQSGNGNQLWAVDRLTWRSAGTPNPNSQGFYFDDMQVEAVPEPGTVAALGLGVAALIRRRMKRA